MNGILLVDKPVGLTSHDVVEYVRKLFKTKVGHCGTLDPFASGLLVLLIGEATKLSSFFTQTKKTYIATMQFGIKTDTLDITGKVQLRNNIFIEQNEIEDCLKDLKGEVELSVPIYSAKKVKGRKLYEYAREGIDIEIPKIKSIIYSIEMINYCYPYMTFKVECSHGTYIRSLAEEIAKKLSTVATLVQLRRAKNGVFDIKAAFSLDFISEDSIIPLENLILNEIIVNESVYKKLINGNPLTRKDIKEIRLNDSLFEDFYKISMKDAFFVYKREGDKFKYLLKVENYR
ncbi:tRNA pseudouridine synthase B [Caldicellulosiruptor saccharolyticus DSM 8903]|uniref:tRNA pseudouridine synthase B n=1 Tax=Caldicellulosiruptor saccharolyticus (strain ATCC 43494 / DSM 8903 / Tp8T 6331) TaxID=351627 RepID=TRUB_CALS8|nr:tRNA pseudouridine(55) synthase TruB [Caldicellulosiruptor saccharolyticus]A4XL67.1 RecName: Full=tRNA pseudouridine synthase B; AltName: Full=tRNA pseudouridine(55) synthase; Short=Psi55 synthase; AltName: Full=tRNA pseudouridylate synthase; AltName: Full=tRNA-uridine isomerase [Caldicellulosiruptor saccharolyticus DSM 8903]ABP67652.1 tRNA pseudouridine synthase B [Caldicellulosiruptor saccharolyticus DSM 8903]